MSTGAAWLGDLADTHSGSVGDVAVVLETSLRHGLSSAEAEERLATQSAFSGLFRNRWLWRAIGLSVVLQLVVLYIPPLQRAFGTVALGGDDWLRWVVVASTVLWYMEIRKLVARATWRRTLRGASRGNGTTPAAAGDGVTTGRR